MGLDMLLRVGPRLTLELVGWLLTVGGLLGLLDESALSLGRALG